MIQILNNPERDQPWRLRITAQNNEVLVWGESVTSKSDCFTQLEAVARELGADKPYVIMDRSEFFLISSSGDTEVREPITIYKEAR